MPERATEAVSDSGQGLDLLPHAHIARHLAEAQARALEAITPALGDLTKGADLMADALHGGGALIYAAAGSSGLMAAADALELSGTFGVPPEQIHILMAGGQPTSSQMPGGTEDDADAARQSAEIITARDCVIVVTASGSTPYAVAMAMAARETGAQVICIANTAHARVFDHATLPICLPTPPEPLAGSTRMGAGTAQKVALNIMSTLMAVKLGHVHDGMMVNLRVDNAKLKDRATGTVARIAQVPEIDARRFLEAADYLVKPAVLIAAGATTRTQAEMLLKASKGHLRAALAQL